MSTDAPIVIEHSNLSAAWSHLLLEAMRPGRRGLRPVVLTIGGFPEQQPPEVKALRDALDRQLAALGKNATEVSALTIFPYKMWVRRGRPSCGPFSDLCVNRFLPRIRKRDSRNQYGTYFERMMAFTAL